MITRNRYTNNHNRNLTDRKVLIKQLPIKNKKIKFLSKIMTTESSPWAFIYYIRKKYFFRDNDGKK